MGKASQRRIDLVFKRKRDDLNEVGEDHSSPADHPIPLPLVELEQQQQQNQNGLQQNQQVLFTGSEFLQRDPGLRPQIWQYPPEQRDSVRRAYFQIFVCTSLAWPAQFFPCSSATGYYIKVHALICNLLAPALHTLIFEEDNERMEGLTEEQEKALQLLTSLHNLGFWWCEGLQSLPQGLHRLSSLKELRVFGCEEIRSMPKEGLPVSLRELQMNKEGRSAEIKEQIEKIKRGNPDLYVY